MLLSMSERGEYASDPPPSSLVPRRYTRPRHVSWFGPCSNSHATSGVAVFTGWAREFTVGSHVVGRLTFKFRNSKKDRPAIFGHLSNKIHPPTYTTLPTQGPSSSIIIVVITPPRSLSTLCQSPQARALLAPCSISPAHLDAPAPGFGPCPDHRPVRASLLLVSHVPTNGDYIVSGTVLFFF